MNRVIITNNKIVAEKFDGRAEITFMKDVKAPEVFEKGKEIAAKGGKLIVMPSAGNVKNYYRSLLFLMGDAEEDIGSMAELEKCLKLVNAKEGAFAKEPVMAGMHQKKDMEQIKKVMG